MFVKILGFDVRWMVTSSGCIPLGALATRGAPIRGACRPEIGDLQYLDKSLRETLFYTKTLELRRHTEGFPVNSNV